jgi:hypothetical protein
VYLPGDRCRAAAWTLLLISLMAMFGLPILRSISLAGVFVLGCAGRVASSGENSGDGGVGDPSTIDPSDAGAGCPTWAALSNDAGVPASCEQVGLQCTYVEGQAECVPSSPSPGWWLLPRAPGCPQRQPTLGAACTSAGGRCDYFSPRPLETFDLCCDGDTLLWETESVRGCRNGNKCGVIHASDYDQTCVSDADCVAVTDGDLCDSNRCSCPSALISSRVAAQYAADYAQKFNGLSGAGCSCPFAPPVCKNGLCGVSVPGLPR